VSPPRSRERGTRAERIHAGRAAGRRRPRESGQALAASRRHELSVANALDGEELVGDGANPARRAPQRDDLDVSIFTYNVNTRVNTTTDDLNGNVTKARPNVKANLALGPWWDTELFANVGTGSPPAPSWAASPSASNPATPPHPLRAATAPQRMCCAQRHWMRTSSLQGSPIRRSPRQDLAPSASDGPHARATQSGVGGGRGGPLRGPCSQGCPEVPLT
jgi:hypothetical protein